jgi:hypothetical protein
MFTNEEIVALYTTQMPVFLAANPSLVQILAFNALFAAFASLEMLSTVDPSQQFGATCLNTLNSLYMQVTGSLQGII